MFNFFMTIYLIASFLICWQADIIIEKYSLPDNLEIDIFEKSWNMIKMKKNG